MDFNYWMKRNMKNYKLIFGFIGCILSLASYGQTDEVSETNYPGIVLAFPTPNGNLIRIIPREESRPQFGEILKKTSHFKVNRGYWVEGGEALPYVGKTERVKSAKELKAKVGDRLYQDFLKLKKFTSDKQVDQYVQTEFNYDSLLNYTEQSSAFLKAFGLGFFDTEAKKDTVYVYEAIRVDVSGAEEVWGAVQIGSKVSNPLLSKIQIRQDTVLTTDSLAYFTFSVQFPGDTVLSEEYPTFDEIDDDLPIEEYLTQYRAQIKQLVAFLNTRPITPETITFSIFMKKNDEPEWQLFERQLPAADSLGNLQLRAYIEAEPEDKVSVKILPEDYAGAIGQESDVYSAYAISKGTVPLIYGVNGKDSTNCIVLNWEKLPLKPYYSGVLIERSQGENPVEQLAILESESTQFEDYAIEPGLIYNYSVRALFPEKQNVKQDMPASVSLSGNSVAPPLPPYNLTVDTTTTEFPTLRWEASESKSRFGYIVYTGLAPSELAPMPGIVKENFLIDSTGVYSGKLTYYFAVLEQNILQDTSAFSNIVSFKPTLPVSFVSPSYVTASLVNSDVLLEWQELRERDEYVAGYQVQRRKLGEDTFATISPEVLTANTFVDTTFVRGTTYEYRVASVSIEGEVGVFSMASEINFPLDPLDPPTNLDIQNTSEGIMVKWPAVEENRVKEYVVYRGTSVSEPLTEIARVPSGLFQFEDTTVEAASNYIYAVSIVDSANQEGLKSNKKSINRIAPKTL